MEKEIGKKGNINLNPYLRLILPFRIKKHNCNRM